MSKYDIKEIDGIPQLHRNGERVGNVNSAELQFWQERQAARAELKTARAALHSLKATATAIKMLGTLGMPVGVTPEDVLGACNQGLQQT